MTAWESDPAVGGGPGIGTSTNGADVTGPRTSH